MKKLLFVPALLIAGSIELLSCNNTDAAKTEMKTPVENKEKEQVGATVNKEAAQLKTIENMQAAFKGETTASAKYAAYSKKAEQEGYHAIALLYKAASTAENIHANNHKAVLQESGIAVPQIKPEYIVKSTKENLEDAIKGETYEATVMYPDFLKTANDAGNQIALISLNYAYKTEKKHRVMYETALAALQHNTAKALPVVFYVCPTCGNTYETTAPARCGISMTGSEKFIKITSL